MRYTWILSSKYKGLTCLILISKQGSSIDSLRIVYTFFTFAMRNLTKLSVQCEALEATESKQTKRSTASLFKCNYVIHERKHHANHH